MTEAGDAALGVGHGVVRAYQETVNKGAGMMQAIRLAASGFEIKKNN